MRFPYWWAAKCSARPQHVCPIDYFTGYIAVGGNTLLFCCSCCIKRNQCIIRHHSLFQIYISKPLRARSDTYDASGEAIVTETKGRERLHREKPTISASKEGKTRATTATLGQKQHRVAEAARGAARGATVSLLFNDRSDTGHSTAQADIRCNGSRNHSPDEIE